MFALSLLAKGKELVRNSTSDFKVNFQNRDEVMQYLRADTGILIVTTQTIIALSMMKTILFSAPQFSKTMKTLKMD